MALLKVELKDGRPFKMRSEDVSSYAPFFNPMAGTSGTWVLMKNGFENWISTPFETFDSIMMRND